jgi:hypothetical protein
MQSNEYIKIQFIEVAQRYFSDADFMLFGSRTNQIQLYMANEQP